MQQQQNEDLPLLRDNQSALVDINQSPSITGNDTVTDIEGGDPKEETQPTVITSPSSSPPPPPIPGEESDAVITKQQNIPIIEIMAITAIISGSLSMYWGISGLVVGSAASTIVSMIVTTIITQPIIIVHVIMSTCVVVLAPVVTVQKVQLRTLGTLREQQNELRTQINTLNQTNDELTKSVTSIADEASNVEEVNQELQNIATTNGTTMDRLVQLYTEQEEIQKQIYKNLQAKILEQIVTILLQTDSNHNNIVSENEVDILIDRFKQISGITFNERAFRSIVNHSEPKGSITITDICTIVRNVQQQYKNDTTPEPITTTTNNKNNNTTGVDKSSNNDTVDDSQLDEPIFTFQLQQLLLQN